MQMMVPAYVFKLKAKQALKGNWQTAMLVSFFSGILLTALSVLQSMTLPDIMTYLSYGMVEEAYAQLLAVPTSTWIAYYGLAAVAFAVTPVLTLGANHYFVNRIKGKELGFTGLFARLNITGKALLLYARMFVRIFLWSLLLIVPGILAALRYSMAPYFLAENPEMSTTEAIEKSKHAMDGKKLGYVMLELSFLVWVFASMIIESLLFSVSFIVAFVASQFLRLYISTYMNGACAAFYEMVSKENGISEALRSFRERMSAMGMDDDSLTNVDKAVEEAKRAEEEMNREVEDDGAEDAFGGNNKPDGGDEE